MPEEMDRMSIETELAALKERVKAQIDRVDHADECLDALRVDFKALGVKVDDLRVDVSKIGTRVAVIIAAVAFAANFLTGSGEVSLTKLLGH